MKKYFFGFLLAILTILPLSAQLWSSPAPLALKTDAGLFFPAFKNYHPSEFGFSRKARMTPEDYKKVKSEWSLWPLNPWGPENIDKKLKSYPSAPSSSHLFGTDSAGRDVFAISLYGLRIAYIYSLIVCAVTIFLGYFIGGLLGFFGGVADLFSQRVVETLSLIPFFFLVILALSMFRGGLALLVAISCIFGWMGVSQLIRTETLKARKESYVEAAKALGGSRLRVFFKHIAPNVSLVVFTQAPFMFIGHIGGLAVLDYLGMGISNEYPSLGGLIAEGKKQIYSGWWMLLFPSLILGGALTGWVAWGENFRRKIRR